MRSARLLPLLFYLSLVELCGQSTGRMETDRPDQAECANVVKAGYLQGEFGFNFNNYGSTQEWDVPTSLIKYGIANRLELQYVSILQFANGGSSYRPDVAGLKVFLFPGKKWIPRTTVIGHYHFNDDKRDNSDNNRTHHSVGELVLTFQNDITESFGIGYNFGPEFHSDGTTEWIYRLTPGWNLNSRDFFYAEIFGRVAQGNTQVWADAGIARYLNDDLKVDFSAGLNLQQKKQFYGAIGISWRFKVYNQD